MERSIYKKLLKWKDKPEHKPLILNGARQVGKTYILQEFGKREYKKLAFFSLDRNQKAVEVFDKGGSTADMLMALSAISQIDITPNDTLVVLDEIQECPKALEALKFFCEDAPDIHIIVAGSLLGISLHSGVSYPVGKVEELRLYPMNFIEFLDAMGKEKIASILKEENWNVINLLETELISLLRQYYYVGGMPAAVLAHVEQKGLQEVRSIQKQIIQDYRRDFSKHAPDREVPRINMVWDSIPAQLAKENKKFIYGAVRSGARAKDFEMAIQWLVDAGLTYRISRVREVGMPLKFYEDLNAFKLFLLDVGLLGALSEMEPAQMLISNKAMTESKGAFTENYVLTQLLCQQDIYTYYYSREDARLEIDFLAQHQGVITPIEVKAEENLRSKSLRAFFDAHPDLQAIRFSMSPYKEQEWMKNVPLYGVEESF